MDDGASHCSSWKRRHSFGNILESVPPMPSYCLRMNDSIPKVVPNVAVVPGAGAFSPVA